MARMRTGRYWRCLPPGGLELTAGAYSGSAFVPHVHEGLVVTVVVAGELCLQTGQAALRVRNGDIAVIAPKLFHRVCDRSGRGWSERVAYVAENQLRELGFALPDEQQETVRIIRQRKVATKFAALHKALEQDPHRVETCRALYAILADILTSAARAELTIPVKSVGIVPAQAAFVHAIRQTITRRFTEPLKLSELGNIAGHNADYLQKCFKEAYGVSPYELITFMRVQYAKNQIMMGKSIVEAALDSGFCDQSHLHRRFYQVYGLTPGQYRMALNSSSCEES
jgi:AraC-like DNA-binding protein